MRFSGTSLELKPTDVTYNPTQRQLYKNMMNSIIGKFSQRQHFANTKYVSTAEEIEEVLETTGEEIIDFQTISEDICELQTAAAINDVKKHVNRKANHIITAFVTSLSRIDMHKNIELLRKQNFYPLYTDTDSIIFGGGKNLSLPFELNGGLGYFKHEGPSAPNGFCCIGKKSYAVSFGKETDVKVCGLSFSAYRTKSSVKLEEFENFLRKKTPLQPVLQTQTRKANIFSVTKKVSHVKIPSNLNFGRVLRNDARRMYTEPFGFNKPT